MLSVTDNEATRTTFLRTRPALREDEDEAEAGCYESEAMAENFGFEATLASRTLDLTFLDCATPPAP